MFLACGFASFGLLIATKGDVSILKVILFSRSLIACLNILSETGWVRVARQNSEKEKYRWTMETIVTMVSTVYISYAYTFQYEGLSPMLQRKVAESSGLNIDEKRFFECIRAVTEIKRRFPQFSTDLK